MILLTACSRSHFYLIGLIIMIFHIVIKKAMPKKDMARYNNALQSKQIRAAVLWDGIGFH
ncbi:hypothetical protein AA0313_1844 [Acetobacter indonesiensis NRIC 0313]|nr:hypothetical protein Abin_019_004 [Acetobacter indonesiensis]GBQ58617.1 hypothetical protein AA0313_1844 [Acetobacter indonesiensis NRIC 0313]